MDSACPHGGGPQLNNDISGVGVRISFYVQTLLLSILCTRSGSLDEITGAMYTLISTNMAIAVTALILGLKPKPEISLHDGLVVLYLLFLAWIAVTSSLPSCNNFQIKDHGTDNSVRLLKAISVLQSYLLFAFALVLVIQTPTFGNAPECNQNAVAVFFGPFKIINKGRIVGAVFTCTVILIYSTVTILDYIPQKQKEQVKNIMVGRKKPQWLFKSKPNNQPETGTNMEDFPSNTGRPLPQDARMSVQNPKRTKERARHHVNFSGEIVSKLVLIFIFWGIGVLNTELLIHDNHFERADDTQSVWQFGQVLPLFLLVLPAASTVNAFMKHGVRRWQDDKEHLMMKTPHQAR